MSLHHYGAYIWPAYGVSALAFLWMIADSVLRTRRWRRKARNLEAAERK